MKYVAVYARIDLINISAFIRYYILLYKWLILYVRVLAISHLATWHKTHILFYILNIVNNQFFLTLFAQNVAIIANNKHLNTFFSSQSKLSVRRSSQFRFLPSAAPPQSHHLEHKLTQKLLNTVVGWVEVCFFAIQTGSQMR